MIPRDMTSHTPPHRLFLSAVATDLVVTCVDVTGPFCNSYVRFETQGFIFLLKNGLKLEVEVTFEIKASQVILCQ